MPTPHDTFREQLLDLSYGELGKREEKALRGHLEACAACRAELAQLEGTRGAMAALGQEPAPERGEAILLAAAREVARQRQVKPRPFLPAWLWGTSLSAVAAVAVALISYKLAQGPNAFQRHPVDELVPSPAPAEVASAPAASSPEPLARAEPAEADALGGAVASGAGAPAERKAAAPAPAPRPSLAATPRRERSAPEKAKQAVDGTPSEPRYAQAPAAAEPAAAPAAPQAHEKEAQAEGERLAADEAGPGEAKGNTAARPGVVASAAPPSPASSASALAEEAPPPPPPLEAARRDQAAGAIGGGASRAQAEQREAPVARARAMSKAAAAAEPEDAIARHQRLRVAGRLHTASAAYPGCSAEASRELDLDSQGRVVRYTRRGTHAGAPFQAELFYGEDGRLGAIRYQAQGRVHELRPSGADSATAGIPAFALEPRQADRAGLDAPPRCGG